MSQPTRLQVRYWFNQWPLSLRLHLGVTVKILSSFGLNFSPAGPWAGPSLLLGVTSSLLPSQLKERAWQGSGRGNLVPSSYGRKQVWCGADQDTVLCTCIIYMVPLEEPSLRWRNEPCSGGFTKGNHSMNTKCTVMQSLFLKNFTASLSNNMGMVK